MTAVEVDEHPVRFSTGIPGALRQDRRGAHQNRKYRWAIGSTCAGSHVRSTPSARTSYVSGSTSMLGVASLLIIDALPMPPRVLFTAAKRRRRPSDLPMSAS